MHQTALLSTIFKQGYQEVKILFSLVSNWMEMLLYLQMFRQYSSSEGLLVLNVNMFLTHACRLNSDLKYGAQIIRNMMLFCHILSLTDPLYAYRRAA